MKENLWNREDRIIVTDCSGHRLRKRKEGNKTINMQKNNGCRFFKRKKTYKLNVESAHSLCIRIDSNKTTPKCFLQIENIKDEKEISSVSMKERQVIYTAATITIDSSSTMLSTKGQGNAI